MGYEGWELLFPATFGFKNLFNPNESNTKKIYNLLHRGQGVQGGREDRAYQAGRAYHPYQQDQQDPAGWRARDKERKKKGSGSDQTSAWILNRAKR